jgi:hypothetical protein
MALGESFHGDDDREIPMAALVRNFVDPDANEAIEGVMGGPSVIDHSGDDRPDGSPGHVHQGDHSGLGGVGDEPGQLVIEVPGVADAVAGPGHLGDCRSVLGAVDLGASAWSKHITVPRSSARQFRLPSPWS